MEGPAGRRKKRKLEQLSPEQLESYRLGAFLITCFKVNTSFSFQNSDSDQEMNLTGAIEAYRLAKSKNIYPPKDAFNNFVAFAAGLGDQGSGSFPPRTQDPPSDILAAFEIYGDAILMNASLSEASYSGLIRCCAVNKRKEDGLALLEEMLHVKQLTPRNRTYSALLNAYCGSGDKETSLKLMKDLTNTHQLPLLERDFLSLLQLALHHEDTPLFYTTLHTMMEEILVPTLPEIWELLGEWFAKAPRNGKYSVVRSKVSSTQGELERCKYTLQSIELTRSNKLKLLSEIEKSILGTGEGTEGGGGTVSTAVPGGAAGATEEPPKTKRRVNKVMASREKWNEFQAWLSQLHEEITQYSHRSSCPGKERYVLIDGANVGFYQQNYLNAPNHVNYLQIQAMVTHLLQVRKMIPIVILHCRHISSGTVPPACSELVNHWKASAAASIASSSPGARFYFTPGGYNDDIFWLYATVRLDVHVVTNDEMRDHHFQMLSPRWFIRWKDRHQIHFSFGKLTRAETSPSGGECEMIGTGEEGEEGHPAIKHSMREVSVVFPLTYSHRMQVLIPNRDPTAINRGLFGTHSEEQPGGVEEEEQEGLIEQEGEGYFIPLLDHEEWLCIVPNDLEKGEGEGRIVV
jgi:pentatricopeptide repeat protein